MKPTMQMQQRSVHIMHSLPELRAFRETARREGKTIGFVPTMGALHAGHLDLVGHARKHADIVVASIFVNPAQFAPHEDLDQYPRTLPDDVRALEEHGVATAVFAPSVATMYPRGITTHVDQQKGTFVSVAGMSHQMEGKVRPHFFRGVATVVTKLVNAVQPDTVVFGQKDAQQCCVVRAMLEDLLVNTRMVVAPTVRDQVDGLALSSRNRYLSPEHRSLAPALAAGLLAAQAKFEQGVSSRAELVAAVEDAIRTVDPAGQTLQLEYVSLATRDLVEVDEVKRGDNPDADKSVGAILSAAMRVESTRLIDNVVLGCWL
ncbi:pantoate-beta-alanine ligase [Blastocladiella emersonii ATCC 22665]|nr:pantoate-beta-alanine ligase [Blastocladiella emersonii ATCC 22665]